MSNKRMKNYRNYSICIHIGSYQNIIDLSWLGSSVAIAEIRKETFQILVGPLSVQLKNLGNDKSSRILFVLMDKVYLQGSETFFFLISATATKNTKHLRAIQFCYYYSQFLFFLHIYSIALQRLLHRVFISLLYTFISFYYVVMCSLSGHVKRK